MQHDLTGTWPAVRAERHEVGLFLSLPIGAMTLSLVLVGRTEVQLVRNRSHNGFVSELHSYERPELFVVEGKVEKAPTRLHAIDLGNEQKKTLLFHLRGALRQPSVAGDTDQEIGNTDNDMYFR